MNPEPSFGELPGSGKADGFRYVGSRLRQADMLDPGEKNPIIMVARNHAGFFCRCRYGDFG
jgi:hypothetical protein